MAMKDFKYDTTNKTGIYSADMAPVEPGEELRSTAQNRPIENLMKQISNQLTYLRNTNKGSVLDYTIYERKIVSDTYVLYSPVKLKALVDPAKGVTLTYPVGDQIHIIKGSPAFLNYPTAYISVEYLGGGVSVPDPDMRLSKFITIQRNTYNLATQNNVILIQNDLTIPDNTIRTYEEEPVTTMDGGSVTQFYTKLRVVLNKTFATIGDLKTAVEGVGYYSFYTSQDAGTVPFLTDTLGATILNGKDELLITLQESAQRVAIAQPSEFFQMFFDGQDDRSSLFFSVIPPAGGGKLFMNPGIYGFVNSNLDNPGGSFSSTTTWTNTSWNFTYIPIEFSYLEGLFRSNPATYYPSTIPNSGNYELFKAVGSDSNQNPFITFNTVDVIPHINFIPFFIVEPDCIRFVNGRSITIDEFLNMQDFVGAGNEFDISLSPGVSNLQGGQDKASMERFDISDFYGTGTPWDELGNAIMSVKQDPTDTKINTLDAVAYLTQLGFYNTRKKDATSTMDVGGRVLVVNPDPSVTGGLMYNSLTDAIENAIDGDSIYLVPSTDPLLTIDIDLPYLTAGKYFDDKFLTLYSTVQDTEIKCLMDADTGVSFFGPYMLVSPPLPSGELVFNFRPQFNINQVAGKTLYPFVLSRCKFQTDVTVSYEVEDTNSGTETSVVPGLALVGCELDHLYIQKNSTTIPSSVLLRALDPVNSAGVLIDSTMIKSYMSFMKGLTAPRMSTDCVMFSGGSSYGTAISSLDDRNSHERILTGGFKFGGTGLNINLVNASTAGIRYAQYSDTVYESTDNIITFGMPSMPLQKSRVSLTYNFTGIVPVPPHNNTIGVFRTATTASLIGAYEAEDNDIEVALTGDDKFIRSNLPLVGIENIPGSVKYFVLFNVNGDDKSLTGNTITITVNDLFDPNNAGAQVHDASVLRIDPGTSTSLYNYIGMINLSPTLSDLGTLVTSGAVWSTNTAKGSTQLWRDNTLNLHFGNGRSLDNRQQIYPHHGGLKLGFPMPFINFGIGVNNTVNITGKHEPVIKSNYLSPSNPTGILYAFNYPYYLKNELNFSDMYLLANNSDQRHTRAVPNYTQCVATLTYGCKIYGKVSAENIFYLMSPTNNNFAVTPAGRNNEIMLTTQTGDYFPGLKEMSVWLNTTMLRDCNFKINREYWDVVAGVKLADGFDENQIDGTTNPQPRWWGVFPNPGPVTTGDVGVEPGDMYYNSDDSKVYVAVNDAAAPFWAWVALT